MNRAVKLTMVTPGGQLTDPTAPLELELELQPLKPFEVSAQLIINKASGGRCVWAGVVRSGLWRPLVSCLFRGGGGEEWCVCRLFT